MSELVAYLMKLVGKTRLAQGARKGLWIAEQQTFVFVQRKIRNQSCVWAQLRNFATDVVLYGALDALHLLNIRKMRRWRGSWESLT